MLFQRINQEHVEDRCVNVTRNFPKIYRKRSGIGNHFTTRIGEDLIVKLFAALIQTIARKLYFRILGIGLLS